MVDVDQPAPVRRDIVEPNQEADEEEQHDVQAADGNDCILDVGRDGRAEVGHGHADQAGDKVDHPEQRELAGEGQGKPDGHGEHARGDEVDESLLEHLGEEVRSRVVVSGLFLPVEQHPLVEDGRDDGHRAEYRERRPHEEGRGDLDGFGEGRGRVSGGVGVHRRANVPVEREDHHCEEDLLANPGDDEVDVLVVCQHAMLDDGPGGVDAGPLEESQVARGCRESPGRVAARRLVHYRCLLNVFIDVLPLRGYLVVVRQRRGLVDAARLDDDAGQPVGGITNLVVVGWRCGEWAVPEEAVDAGGIHVPGVDHPAVQQN